VSTAQAYQTILGAAAVIVALVAQSMVARRFAKQQAEKVVSRVDDVHELVNGTATAQVERIDQLEQTITASGATLPPIPPKEDA
jgi:peptidyl-tRNA hydrolase